jgi:dipeptidyl aminopeptidase/acylaminoacyl peptidase
MGQSVQGLRPGRARYLWLPLIVAIAAGSKASLAQETSPSGPRRMLTIEDIVATREIVDQRLSPDGREVAFTVQRARLATDDYETRLMLVRVDSGARPRVVWMASSIGNLRWVPDGTALTFIAPSDGPLQVLRLARGQRTPRPLLSTPLPVLAFEWSPDGRALALLVQQGVDSAARRDWANNGIVYDSTLTTGDLLAGTGSRRPPEQVVRWSSATGRLDTLWTAPDAIREMVWSPDGTRLAVQYRASGRPADMNNMDIAVLSPGARSFEPVVTWTGWEERPRWAPDGRALVFQSEGPLLETDRHWVQQNTMFVSRLDGGAPTPLGPWTELREAHAFAWTPEGTEVLFERGGRSGGAIEAIQVAGGLRRRLARTDDHLSRCSAAADGGAVSCVRQSLTVPPEIALLNPSSGSVRTLTRLHPEYDTLRFGAGREVRWTNRYGAITNGFLFTPPAFRPGHRYPFLVCLYGFTETFSAQGQWISSLPVAALAADGFVVLLMNHPYYGPFRWGGSEAEVATFWERDNTLASIEAAVDTLVTMGVADRRRGGIMGWSMGSLWADLAITRTRLFAAASSGEIGARTPGTYWAGNAQTRYLQRSLFGGPPAGPWYARYLHASPPLAVPPRDVPVLREFDTQSVWGLEYAAWIEQGAMMEMVFYPNSGHVFDRPAQRRSSMRRNRAWFNFWLRGETRQGWASDNEYAQWGAWRAHLMEAQVKEPR